MKAWVVLFLSALSMLSLSARTAAAQAPENVAVPIRSPVPVTVEYYYRIRWGNAEEFNRLYNQNHAPLLDEMQKIGFIRSIVVEQPFTHMAGGPRWDLRVTIEFRDATAAISDPDWDRLWAEAKGRLYPDAAKFDLEETRRFSLLEDHWDVIVNEMPSQ